LGQLDGRRSGAGRGEDWREAGQTAAQALGEARRVGVAVFPQVSLANLQARKLDAQIWTAGALAGMVR